MKTLSDVSRKAHSNVLSLAERGLCRRAATSGRQDFRQLSFESRIPQKRSQAGKQGGWKDRVQGAGAVFANRVQQRVVETLTNLTRAFCVKLFLNSPGTGLRGKFGD